MNRGLFSSQVNQAEEILNDLNLLKGRNTWPSYGEYAASFFRDKGYIENWQLSFDNMLYDFLLQDDSLLQFKGYFAPLNVSYTYLECPFKEQLTFEQFVHLHGYDDDDGGEIELIREYEFYIAMPELKGTYTPIRYDYSPGLYKEGCHPASHFHFGYNNEIRLGTRKILRPLSFLLLTIRQCYPEAWSKLTEKDDAAIMCRNIRENPVDVEVRYWNRKDQWEMFLV